MGERGLRRVARSFMKLSSIIEKRRDGKMVSVGSRAEVRRMGKTNLICIRAPGSNIPGCHLNFSCCSRNSTSRIGVT